MAGHDMPPTGPKAQRVNASGQRVLEQSQATQLNVQDAQDKWNFLRPGESFHPQTLDPTHRPGLGQENATLKAQNADLLREMARLRAQNEERTRERNSIKMQLDLWKGA